MNACSSAPAILTRACTEPFGVTWFPCRGLSGRTIDEESARATDGVDPPRRRPAVTTVHAAEHPRGPGQTLLRNYRAQLSSRGVTECRRAA